MYVSYLSGIFDFTGMQMVLTMKLTSFAYNYFDGTYDKKRVFREHSDPKVAKTYADRRRFAITSLPNPLEFYGYVYCFTCLLAGPAFEYTDYVRAVDQSTTSPPSVTRSYPVSTLPIAFRKFIIGLLCLALHLVVSKQFKMSTLYTDNFMKFSSIPYRLSYAYLAIFAQRCRFYFAWKIAEASCIMGEFGVSVSDRQYFWEGVEIVDIIQVETAVSLQSLTRHWNKRTQQWLERYVYRRTNNSLIAAYFISAIWHGPYPGFMMFFLTIPLITIVERQVRCKLNPIFIGDIKVNSLSCIPRRNASMVRAIILSSYWLTCWLCLTAEMVYLAHLFIKLSALECLTVISSYYYLGHVIPIILYGFLRYSPIRKLKIKAI